MSRGRSRRYHRRPCEPRQVPVVLRSPHGQASPSA
jgi:hypothetical protein